MVFNIAYMVREALYMKKLLSCLLLFVIIAGCSNEQSFEPVEINPEVDVCEVCNMSLSN